ncbi:MAG: hypothetical protein DRP93_00175 [Candidatus Neomarinimicrobiota bacterium]|nr:MAG: hypothetical protein DRP93_00175 [Candidatus Neomarinimicrobiota bacterium]
MIWIVIEAGSPSLFSYLHQVSEDHKFFNMGNKYEQAFLIEKELLMDITIRDMNTRAYEVDPWLLVDCSDIVMILNELLEDGRYRALKHRRVRLDNALYQRSSNGQ